MAGLSRRHLLARGPLVGAAVGLMSVGALAACGQPTPPLPARSSAKLPGATTALDPAQLRVILAACAETMSAADARTDPTALEDRLTGTALAQRKALYTWWADNDNHPTTPTGRRLMSDPIISLIGPSDSWPRNVLVALEGIDSNSRILVALRQDNVRAVYKIWAGIRVLGPKGNQPSIVIPPVPQLPYACPALGLDDTTLVRTPRAVTQHYFDVLINGKASPFFNEFMVDSYFDAFEAELDSYRSAQDGATPPKPLFAPPVATLTSDFKEYCGWKMPDGGAVFLAGAVSTLKVQNLSTNKIELPSKMRALTKSTTFDRTLELTNSVVVAFYVPPIGSTGDAALVRCIGMDADLGDGLGVGIVEGRTAIIGPGDKFGTTTVKVT